MLPPKKSKAARSVHQEETQDEAKTEETKKDEMKKENVAPPEGHGDDEDVNIFKVEIVEGKRSRCLPAGEQSLQEWVGVHLENKDEFEVVLSDAYDNYVSSCVAAGAFAATQYEFMKAVKEKFPNGACVKKSSPYDGMIRVKKPRKEKPDKDKAPKADSLKLKMKDIITTALEDLGNPNKGVQFNKLKLHIAGNVPALRIEQKPKLLLYYLERSVHYGHLERVKGVGMCGYFRLYGPSKSDEEDKENKEEKKVKDKDTEEDKSADKEPEKEGKDKEEGDKEEQEPEDEKKKKKEEEGDKVKEEAEDDDGKRKTRKRKAPAKGKGKSKGKKKGAKETKKYRSFVVHSDPERIEDAFSLAMTFMVEPKEASARKILKYINDYYDRDLTKEKLRSCLESGCDKGYWEQVTGQGFSGTFHLLMDEFDPTADDDLVGKVTNALVACTEPKQCSANLLKSYMIEYHKEKFDITNRPHLFKKSLERGLNKDIIRQLSGIGASGSFQLAEVFTPTPVILRGEDEESDYASNTEPESDISEDDGQGYGPFHISTFQDRYNPRPTKRRGHGRAAAAAPPPPQKPSNSSRGQSKSSRTSHSTSKKAKSKPNPNKKSIYYEESDSDDDAPAPRRKKGGRQSSRKTKKKSYSEAVKDSDSDDEGSGPASRRKLTPKGRSRSRKQESSDEEDVDSEEAPPPKKARTPAKKPVKKGRGSVVKSTPKKKPVSSDEESEDEAPAPKGGRRGSRGSPRKTSPKKNMKESSNEEDEDSEDEAPAPKKTSPVTPTKRVLAKKYKEKSSEDEDSETFSPIPPPKRGHATPKKAEKSKTYSSDEKSEDEETPVKKENTSTEASPTPPKKSKAKKGKKRKGRRK